MHTVLVFVANQTCWAPHECSIFGQTNKHCCMMDTQVGANKEFQLTNKTTLKKKEINVDTVTNKLRPPLPPFWEHDIHLKLFGNNRNFLLMFYFFPVFSFSITAWIFQTVRCSAVDSEMTEEQLRTDDEEWPCCGSNMYNLGSDCFVFLYNLIAAFAGVFFFSLHIYQQGQNWHWFLSFFKFFCQQQISFVLD